MVETIIYREYRGLVVKRNNEVISVEMSAQFSVSRLMTVDSVGVGCHFEIDGKLYIKLSQKDANGQVAYRRDGPGRPPKNPHTLPYWAIVKV